MQNDSSAKFKIQNHSKNELNSIKENVRKKGLTDEEEENLTEYYLFVNNGLDMLQQMKNKRLELIFDPDTQKGFWGCMMSLGLFKLDLEDRKRRFVNWNEDLQISKKESNYLGEAQFIKQAVDLDEKYNKFLQQSLMENFMMKYNIKGNEIDDIMKDVLECSKEIYYKLPKTRDSEGPTVVLTIDEKGHQHPIRKADVLAYNEVKSNSGGESKQNTEDTVDKKRQRKREKKRKYNKKKKQRKK